MTFDFVGDMRITEDRVAGIRRDAFLGVTVETTPGRWSH